jgi:hypothetical protein
MAQDERAEVQHAAQTALKELRKPPPETAVAPTEDEEASLGSDVLSALERLKAELESGS